MSRKSFDAQELANERRATSRERAYIRRAERAAQRQERAAADYAYRQTLAYAQRQR